MTIEYAGLRYCTERPQNKLNSALKSDPFYSDDLIL